MGYVYLFLPFCTRVFLTDCMRLLAADGGHGNCRRNSQCETRYDIGRSELGSLVGGVATACHWMEDRCAAAGRVHLGGVYNRRRIVANVSVRVTDVATNRTRIAI